MIDPRLFGEGEVDVSGWRVVGPMRVRGALVTVVVELAGEYRAIWFDKPNGVLRTELVAPADVTAAR